MTDIVGELEGAGSSEGHKADIIKALTVVKRSKRKKMTHLTLGYNNSIDSVITLPLQAFASGSIP